jgi:hypothetical protein
MFKLLAAFLCLFFISFLSDAQYTDQQVDSIVIRKQYKQKTIVGLSHEIAKDFEDRRCLLRAFYIYITYNMKYDLNAGVENRKRKYTVKTMDDIIKSDDQEMLKLLKTKRGVCWHFGNLYTRLCAVQGIDVEMISGTRRMKELPDTLSSTHLWNAVEIDGEMKMIDCTINYKLPYKKADFDQYYLVDPEVFIYSSIPMDSEKQYLKTPISYAAFKNLVWPYQMFNLLQVRELTPRFKNLLPRNKGLWNFSFKMDNYRQIDSLEVYVNNKFVRAIPADRTFVSIPLPVNSLSWISIRAVKYTEGVKQNWNLLNYDVLE